MEEKTLEERVSELEEIVNTLWDLVNTNLAQINDGYQSMLTEVNTVIKNDEINIDAKTITNANNISAANAAIDDLAIAILEG